MSEMLFPEDPILNFRGPDPGDLVWEKCSELFIFFLLIHSEPN